MSGLLQRSWEMLRLNQPPRLQRRFFVLDSEIGKKLLPFFNLISVTGKLYQTNSNITFFVCYGRIHVLELGVGMYLLFVGCYDAFFGKNHYYLYLFAQAIAFFIAGFGQIGTIVPNH